MIIINMSRDLDLSSLEIKKVARRSKHYYKIYRKGTKNIFHPSPILKSLQYWLSEKIFKMLPVSEYSMAYRVGCSIRNNARAHLGKNHLLHLDIESYFPSIKEYHIKNLLKNNLETIYNNTGMLITDNDFVFITDIVLYKGHLTIGSVSSPVISNAVMYNIDMNIAEVSRVYQCTYTRYSDDMVFSSNTYIKKDIINDISAILNKYGFNINHTKTYFMSKKGRQEVTGIVLNSGKLSVGRKRKEKIRRMVYKYWMYGEGNKNQILGSLYFLKDIDPDSFNSILIKYKGVIEQLKPQIGQKEVASSIMEDT